MEQLSVITRKLVRADLEMVLRIEQQVHLSPWTMETFDACMASGYDGWVLDFGGDVIGFVFVSIQAGECHILNVGVARKYQHQGFGRLMLEDALAYARRQGAAIAYLEVRRSNSAAIKLYKNMSFQCVGERKDYYPTVAGKEDALIFAKTLIKTS